jgi:hypothetical protein
LSYPNSGSEVDPAVGTFVIDEPVSAAVRGHILSPDCFLLLPSLYAPAVHLPNQLQRRARHSLTLR